MCVRVEAERIAIVWVVYGEWELRCSNAEDAMSEWLRIEFSLGSLRVSGRRHE